MTEYCFLGQVSVKPTALWGKWREADGASGQAGVKPTALRGRPA